MVTTLLLDGMRSAHCARAVHTALAMVPGITAAEVVVGRASLEHTEPLDPRAIDDAVSLAGYAVREIHTERRRLTLLADVVPHAPGEAVARKTGDAATRGSA